MTNILINEETMEIKVIDLGFASSCLNKFEATCGTPSYMAPEIIDKKGYRGDQVDVWSMGVVLYKLLTGEYPFGGSKCVTLGETDPALKPRIRSGVFKPLPESTSKACNDLLKACLSVDPSKRLTTSKMKLSKWLSSHISKPIL